MSDADRAAAVERFRDDYGCGAADSARAARAQFPFDDASGPGDGLARDIGERVAHFVTAIDGLRGNDVGLAATRAIEEYLQLARDHREMHYVRLFENILDASTGPAAAPEPGE